MLTLYFLSTFSRRKLIVVLSWILLISMYPLSKIETIPPLKSVMSQDLALEQLGCKHLQISGFN
jgi:hypothetical protein